MHQHHRASPVAHRRHFFPQAQQRATHARPRALVGKPRQHTTDWRPVTHSRSVTDIASPTPWPLMLTRLRRLQLGIRWSPAHQGVQVRRAPAGSNAIRKEALCEKAASPAWWCLPCRSRPTALSALPKRVCVRHEANTGACLPASASQGIKSVRYTPSSTTTWTTMSYLPKPTDDSRVKRSHSISFVAQEVCHG